MNKKKSVDVISVDDLPAQRLFEMAEQMTEELNDDEAEMFYSKAYAKTPENDTLVLCYAECLKNNQNIQLAKQILIKSLKDRPQGTYKRYFQLAELYSGEESIRIFQQGIGNAMKVNLTTLDLFSSEKSSNKELSRDIANAYAAIAQVCMSDLIDHPEAEIKCVTALQQGQKLDPTCLDVQLQQANYLLFKENEQEAKAKLQNIHRQILAQKEEYTEELKEQTSRYLIEVECFKEAIDILNGLNEVTGRDLQIVYLLAYCYFQMKSYSYSTQFLQECEQIMGQNKIRGEIDDQEVVSAVHDLRNQLNKMDPKAMEEPDETIEEENDEEWMDVQDN